MKVAKYELILMEALCVGFMAKWMDGTELCTSVIVWYVYFTAFLEANEKYRVFISIKPTVRNVYRPFQIVGNDYYFIE